jgi:hypothetical protein
MFAADYQHPDKSLSETADRAMQRQMPSTWPMIAARLADASCTGGH